MKVLLKFLSLVSIFFIMVVISGCGKEMSYEYNRGNSGVGNWRFTAENNLHQGMVDRVTFSEGSLINQLAIDGHDVQTADSFHLRIFADTFKVGTYPAATLNSALDYGPQSSFLYSSSQTLDDFIVRITFIDDILIMGDFSGSVFKDDGDTAKITAGAFTAVRAPALPTSAGVLGSASGSCSPIQIAGVYQQGTALNASNTITVDVTVNTTGTYDIATVPNASGVSFSASGTFTQRGVQQVTLKGTGTPAATSQQDFVLQYGDSQCAFSIDF